MSRGYLIANRTDPRLAPCGSQILVGAKQGNELPTQDTRALPFTVGAAIANARWTGDNGRWASGLSVRHHLSMSSVRFRAWIADQSIPPNQT